MEVVRLCLLRHGESEESEGKGLRRWADIETQVEAVAHPLPRRDLQVALGYRKNN